MAIALKPQSRFPSWQRSLITFLLMVVSGSLAAQSAEPDPRIGVEVILKSWDTRLQVETQFTTGRLPHRIFRVDRTQGDWLWVVAPGFRGWVKSQDVVPLAQALAYFGTEIRANPTDFGLYLRRGYLQTDRADYGSAKADFDEAIRLLPTYPVCYHGRALHWFKRGDFDRAIADINEALRLDPEYANGYDVRAHAYLAKKDLNRALADSEAAIELGPSIASNFHLRALIRFESRDLDRALKDLNEAIRLDPGYAAAFRLRGAIRLKKGEIDHAIADCGEAIRLEPRDGVARHNLEIAWGLKNKSS